MSSNALVQILAFQNQVADLERRLQPLIDDDPNDPAVVKERINLAYIKGKLEAHLEIYEFLHK